MAKAKPARRKKAGSTKASRRQAKRSAKRPTKKAPKRVAMRKARPAARVKAKKAKARPPKARRAKAQPGKVRPAKAARTATPAKPARRPHLDRERRTLVDVVQTPPSSLNMDRHGSAARSGRAEMEASRQNVASMGPDITGGDIDVDVEDAYFTGDEAPGGDNTSPDVDVVDDIGKALGVQYEDNEELKSSDKISERDKHRWEWDPASAEDYKDRK
jgi:hypothetical protein